MVFVGGGRTANYIYNERNPALQDNENMFLHTTSGYRCRGFTPIMLGQSLAFVFLIFPFYLLSQASVLLRVAMRPSKIIYIPRFPKVLSIIVSNEA